jgi:hypothetical protein
MAKCKGWINIYRSGFFHTPGKPDAYDRHPGDIYATEWAALDAIAPRDYYIATVPVTWEEEVIPPVNPGLDTITFLASVDSEVSRVNDEMPGNGGAYFGLQHPRNTWEHNPV